MLDLKTYKFQKISLSMPTDKVLLTEAIERGFGDYNNPYCDLFSELFFKGGGFNLKKDLDSSLKENVFPYFKYFAGSYEPKHEEKTAICAMLLSELVDL